MKVALLTTDNREQLKQYDKQVPFFGTAPEALIKGFQQIGSQIELHVISCSKQQMKSPRKLAENVWFHQPIVPHIGWGRSLFLGCALAVRRLLHEIKPDIVHGQGTERDCAISAICSGYTNILTIHGIMNAVARSHGSTTFSYYGMASALERIAVRRTSGVVCNSTYTESQIAPFARRTWRIPNAIRPAFLKLPMTNIPRSRRIVVLGAIIQYKQSLEILRMWAELNHQTTDVEMVFIGSCGDEGYGSEFKKLLKDPSLQGRASHIPWLECDQLVQYLDSSRGMVHFPTEESFGLAVAEGLVRNLKLFAARTGGVPDVAAGCQGVDFFSSNDWTGLSKKLVEWINEGMPHSKNDHLISTIFSPRSIAEKHLNIYQNLVPS
jgi:glycosyltransferase involved in cell wall biosynthesis